MVEHGQVIEVYYNLHKATFSIRDKKTKRVIDYMDELKLIGSFKVSQAGRQRTINEKRKNVHAYVFGEFVSRDVSDVNIYQEGYYNPYETEFFVDRCERDKVLDGVYEIWLIDKRIFYKEIKNHQ